MDEEQRESEAKRKFWDAYRRLCEEHGLKLSATVVLVPTNHGTYELAVDVKVAPIKIPL